MFYRTALFVVLFWGLFTFTPVLANDPLVSENKDKPLSYPVKNEIDCPIIEYPPCPKSEPNELLRELTWKDRRIHLHRYEGIQGLIVSKMQSYYNRYREQSMRNLWEKSNISLEDYLKIQQQYSDREQDLQQGFRWEDQSWEDCLPPEKGGRVVEVDVIGKELPVIEIAGLTLTNTGKIRLGNWKFNFHNNTTSSAPSTEIIPSNYYLRNYSTTPGLKTFIPTGNIFSTQYCTLSCYPSITLRGDLDYRKVINNVEIEFKFKFFAYHKNYANLRITGRLTPYDQQAAGLFNLEFNIF